MKEQGTGKKTQLSDDAIDGIAAICIIALVVTTVSIWLQNMS